MGCNLADSNGKVIVIMLLDKWKVFVESILKSSIIKSISTTTPKGCR